MDSRPISLMEALELARNAKSAERAGDPFQVYIACGFTPLHLVTYISAWLGQGLPQRRIMPLTGVYGDLPGTLEAAASAQASAIAIFLEWSDLDPRLSPRQAPLRGVVDAEELCATATAAIERLKPRLERLGTLACPVALCCPTLPVSGWGYQTDASETWLTLTLEGLVNRLAQSSAKAGVRIVSRRTIDLLSPAAQRHDVKAELQSGFPYTLPHANIVAHTTARLLVPESPKKAVITDLDDTLWSGIVGEVGPDQVTWDLDHKASLHGHYQHTLATLAAAGVLVGVASKNDAKVVDAALSRSDLIIPRSMLFPIEAHWTPKSESVARMLRVWNIGADAAVFVDDSPLELAEVKQAFPGITCLRFPKEDPAQMLVLFDTLRNLCGRMKIKAEDLLRRESLEQGQEFLAEASGTDTEQFLTSLKARLVFENGSSDPRSIELVNKTNQFNLHGRRYEEDVWRARLARPGAFVWTVSYEDRFGPLGKIAVIAGEVVEKRLRLHDMVLSCRAFSRRVEHASLRFLMDSFGARSIQFDYRRTERNGPLQEFLASILAEGEMPVSEGTPVLTRQAFDARAPQSSQEIVDKVHA